MKRLNTRTKNKAKQKKREQKNEKERNECQKKTRKLSQQHTHQTFQFRNIGVVHSAVRHRPIKGQDDALHAVGKLKKGLSCR